MSVHPFRPGEGSAAAGRDDPPSRPRSHEVLGPRKATVPLVFTSPHSGNRYPEEFVRESRLSREALRRSEDAFVDELFASAPDHGAPLLRALFPRAYVDVNREPFELDQNMFEDRLPAHANVRSKRVAAGLGTIARTVAGGQEIHSRKLRLEEALERIRLHYHPYHRTLRRLVASRRRRFGLCILVDCHSMPSAGGARGPGGPDFVIGDCYGEACAPCVTDVIERTVSGFGYAVARNRPFAGGFTTEHYGDPRNGIHAVQIEIGRGLYMDEFRIARTAGFSRVAAQMDELVSALAQLAAPALAAE